MADSNFSFIDPVAYQKDYVMDNYVEPAVI